MSFYGRPTFSGPGYDPLGHLDEDQLKQYGYGTPPGGGMSFGFGGQDSFSPMNFAYGQEDQQPGVWDKIKGGASSIWGDMSGAEKANLLANVVGTGLAYKGARDDRKDEEAERKRALEERRRSAQLMAQALAGR